MRFRVAVMWITFALGGGCGDDGGPSDASVQLDLPFVGDLSVVRDHSVTVDGLGPCAFPDVSGAPLVVLAYATGTPPTATGGTIVDGTYFLTAETVYLDHADLGGTPGQTREIYHFHGAAFDVSYSAAGMVMGGSGSYTLQGTMLQSTPDCPQLGALTAGYTATPTTLTLVRNSTFNSLPAIVVEELAKQ